MTKLGVLRVFSVAICLVVASCSGDGHAATAEPSSTAMDPPGELVSTTTAALSNVATTSTTTVEPVAEPAPGVSNSVIRVGLSVDLSGPLSSIDSFVLDAQIAYFDMVNDNGGIGGHTVEVVARDHASDIDAHIDNVQELLERSERGVAVISSVGGDEFAGVVSPALVAEGTYGVSRGHVEPGGQRAHNVAHIGQSSCLDAYAGVLRLIEQNAQADESPALAIVARPDAYGARSARGAAAAAEAAEIEVVVNYRGPLDTQAVSELAVSVAEGSPNLIWVAVSPRELRELFLGLEEVDEGASWSGAFQSYDSLLLETSIAASVSGRYTHTASIDLFNSDTNGRSGQIRSAFPGAEYWAADSLAFGWQQAELTHAALAAAEANGDLTRAGISEAFDALVREPSETSFFSVDSQDATLRVPLSDSGSTGLTAISGLSLDAPPVGDACGAAQ